METFAILMMCICVVGIYSGTGLELFRIRVNPMTQRVNPRFDYTLLTLVGSNGK